MPSIKKKIGRFQTVTVHSFYFGWTVTVRNLPKKIILGHTRRFFLIFYRDAEDKIIIFFCKFVNRRYIVEIKKDVWHRWSVYKNSKKNESTMATLYKVSKNLPKIERFIVKG
jgi:hypothetical protein